MSETVGDCVALMTILCAPGLSLTPVKWHMSDSRVGQNKCAQQQTSLFETPTKPHMSFTHLGNLKPNSLEISGALQTCTYPASCWLFSTLTSICEDMCAPTDEIP